MDGAVEGLLVRATRGSAASKALGKRTLYAQLDRPEAAAYAIAREGMADPAVVDMLLRDGAIPVMSPPPEALRRFVDGEVVRWAKVIEQAGLAGSE